MKYYLTFVKHIKDNTESRECLGITDIITAKATMYTKCGNAMNDPNCDYCFGVVNNYLGQAVVPAVSFARPTETLATEEVTE